MDGHVEIAMQNITILGKMAAHSELGGRDKQEQRLAEWIGGRSYQTTAQVKFLVL
ncbi:MAG: hypothetical protein LC128_14790 [Chitinophagales bacterium]|nr:hypothetical protein [Chitinophagales bacterium]